jgi:UDP-2,4-diacetamido-2,4,6-trideoxy-beta-L-altropyranose hydrolase
MGTGHVMRSLALAQEWRDRGRGVSFLTAAPTDPLIARLQSEGIDVQVVSAAPGSVEDANAATDLCALKGSKILIADGYHFGPSFQSAVRSAGIRLLAVDDGVLRPPFDVDWIVNANLHARREDYIPASGRAKLLLGPRYAMLRREFRRRGSRGPEEPARATKLLVALGGGDVLEAALKVVDGLKRLPEPGLEVAMVAGFASGGMKELDAAVAGANHRLRIERYVHDMSSLMAWADLVIASAGSVSWEVAFMGLPSVQLVLADNQTAIAQSLHEAGAAVSLGRVQDVKADRLAEAVADLAGSPEKRSRLARKGREMVDGRGPERLFAEVEESA